MGRKRGQSLTDQQAALAKRQAELDNLESKKILLAIFKKSPHLWGACLKHVQHLGYSEDHEGHNYYQACHYYD